MKISTKGRYALRMLVDLYEHRDEGYISLKDISDRQNVSKSIWRISSPILRTATFCLPHAVLVADMRWGAMPIKSLWAKCSR